MAETTEQYRNRINQLKTSIEKEPYMKNMRSDIAEGISKTGNRQADIEDQFKDVIEGTTGKDVISAPEIIAARKGEASLNARLTKNEQETTAQFQQTTAQLAQTKTDFEIELARNMLNDEQLRAYVDLLQQQVTSMGSISPAPFDTLAQLEAARPNGDNSIYVVVEDGYWYYWNTISGRWTPGDVYQQSGIGSKTVTNSKLSDTYSNGLALDGTANFNTLKRSGVYLYTGSPLNCPPGLTSGIIKNDVVDDRWLYQEVKKIGSDSINSKYERIYDTKEGGGGTWKSVSNTNNYKFPYLTSANDLNNVIEEGKWVAISPINAPFQATWNVKVERYYTIADSSSFWGVQIVTTNTTNNKFDVYIRNFYKTSTSLVFREWVNLNKGISQVSEGIILNFGDSITGNTQGADSVSAAIATRTGAIVHNVGFGGTKVSKHNQYWDAFSLYRLFEEIVKPNSDPTKWNLQDEAILASENGLVGGMPWYFASHLALLKTIDFSKVTNITIASGTNEYGTGVLLDNTTNKKDVTTYGGALRYSLELIMTKHKQIKVLICSPIYRFWMDENGAFLEDSDTRLYNGQSMQDFVEKSKEVSKEYKVSFLDNYNELGINKFNRTLYFPPTDGTHPNATGNKKIGFRIGGKIINE